MKYKIDQIVHIKVDADKYVDGTIIEYLDWIDPPAYWVQQHDARREVNAYTVNDLDRWNLDPSITCECGKEKHGFTSHTTWCPMNAVVGY